MEFNLASFFALITFATGLFMPRIIAYVATSPRRWVNFAIAYGTSALLGIIGAWAGGKFTTDIWMDVMLAITATQASYNMHWAPKKAKGIQ